MLGCGEGDSQVIEAMSDLRKHNVDVVTFGQYLRPSKRHMKVFEYVTPQKFDLFAEIAKEMNFLYVASGPLVRSSYKAGEYFLKQHLEKQDKNNQNSGVSHEISKHIKKK